MDVRWYSWTSFLFGVVWTRALNQVAILFAFLMVEVYIGPFYRCANCQDKGWVRVDEIKWPGWYPCAQCNPEGDKYPRPGEGVH